MKNVLGLDAVDIGQIERALKEITTEVSSTSVPQHFEISHVDPVPLLGSLNVFRGYVDHWGTTLSAIQVSAK